MQLRLLRLTGFKSFVDSTEIPIHKGVTVIVGPNGCGKSNIVESLRWVMGEVSAKRMRGDEMDDVIFSGADGRARRDIAEVSVILDNSKGEAQPPYRDAAELEIGRRIDRGRGSFYSINGAEVRAKDIQFLFADQGSGANSSAIVGQGRITTLLEAPPTERRILLEEAAGIRGLQGRKRESELKLQATETNLHRLQDILEEKRTQNKALEKQVRHAQRYRALADDILATERLLAAIEWWSAYRSVRDLENRAAAHLAALTQAETKVTESEQAILLFSEGVTELRTAAINAQAALQQAQIELKRCEDEEAHIKAQLPEWQERLRQAMSDAEHAKQSALEAENRRQNCLRDIIATDSQVANEQAALQELTPQIQQTQQKWEQIQAQLAAHKQTEEKTIALQRQCDDLIAQEQNLQNKITETETQLQAYLTEEANAQENPLHLSPQFFGETTHKAAQEKTHASPTENLDRAIAQQEQKHSETAQNLKEFRDALSELRNRNQSAMQTNEAELQPMQTELQQLNAEAQFLENLIADHKSLSDKPISQDIKIRSGYEIAIATLFGEAAEAGLSPQDKAYWHNNMPPHKNTQNPIADELIAADKIAHAPQTLQRRLQYSLIAENMETALKYLPQLQPGQTIVAKDGGFCRWDGYIQSAHKTSAFAQNLQHKNRLAELQKIIPQKQKLIAQKQQNIKIQQQKFHSRQNNIQNNIQNAENAMATALAENKRLYDKKQTLQNALAAQAQKRQQRQNRIAFCRERIQYYQNEQNNITENKQQIQEKLKAEQNLKTKNHKDSPQTIKEALQKENQTIAAKLASLQQKQAAMQSQIHYANERKITLQKDSADRQNQAIRETQRAQEYAKRINLAETKIKEYKALPKTLQQTQTQWRNKMQKRQQDAQKASDALTLAENKIRTAESEKNEHQKQTATLRETHIRHDAELQHKKRDLTRIQDTIDSKFLISAEQLISQLGEDEIAAHADKQTHIQDQAERLKTRREAMGEVNLLAEREAQELTEQITQLQKEHDELTEAVRKFRLAITRLNSKARSQLNSAFTITENNFKALFTRLFGGGEAKLLWVGDEDILTAGLEIKVTIPGKKTQLLSLLSGGEQTLTALALLCAVFIGRPAPICVLDEVDALLDDNNVVYFCDLLDYLKEKTQIPFLVISHHRLTMARADRLYGVTMAEKGVSSIVSVNMETQKNAAQ